MKTILSLASICAATAQYSSALSAFDSGASTSQSATITHRGVLTGWLPQLMESSNYALLPGTFFPPETPMEPPGLPVLSISLLESDLRISWPASAFDFVLQSTDALQSSWSSVSARYQTDGTEQFLLVSASESSRFYRLVSR